ncbi:MAG: CHAT domain-containing protein [Pseudomonadota bacterium]
MTKGKRMFRSKQALGVALSAVAMGLAGCAQTTQSFSSLTQSLDARERLDLQADSLGSACTATEATAADPAVPNGFNRSYVVNCRGVSATRPVGNIRLIRNTPENTAALEAALDCDAGSKGGVVTTRAGEAMVSRCVDPAVGPASLVRLDVQDDDFLVVGMATPDALGPIETGMALVAGRVAQADVAEGIQPSSLSASDIPDAPQLVATSVDQVFDDAFGLDLDNALKQGSQLNRAGLFQGASRLLNEALSRTSSATSPATRAELLLEAGLADSNIRFFQSANARFSEAAALIEERPEARSVSLARKQAVYSALNKLNQGDSAGALVDLTKSNEEQPLQDMATIRQLNRISAASGVAADKAISTETFVSGAPIINQLVLDSQQELALARILIDQRKLAEAETALKSADGILAELSVRRTAKPVIAWVESRISQQRARLFLARADYDGAIAAFGAAADALRPHSATAEVAQLELQKAEATFRSNASAADKRTAYVDAFGLYIQSDQPAGVLPASADPYFSLLVEESKTPQADTFDLLFAAMQSSGDAAAARQLSSLQESAFDSPETARLKRRYSDLQNQILSLNYQLALDQFPGETPEAVAQARSKAEADRSKAELESPKVLEALLADPNYRRVTDQPVTVAELREALSQLGPKTTYLKITQLRSRIVALLVSPERVVAYDIAANPAEMAQLRKDLDTTRASIDGLAVETRRAGGQAQVDHFRSDAAHRIFNRVAKADAGRAPVLSASTLVVDVDGMLEEVPFGVLVPDYESATFIDRVRTGRPRDASYVDFLGKRVTIATALSPRSFVEARTRTKSSATRNFLGLGTHVQPGEGDYSGNRLIADGQCSVPYINLINVARRVQPIRDEELRTAATILGADSSSILTKASFTDDSVKELDTIGEYKVLHFATHGVTEGRWLCGNAPPGLVTSIGGEGSDGLLSINEIGRLRLDANLVVLSACSTATGLVKESVIRASGSESVGGTLSGLVRAFLKAEARAVMATVWEASDEPSTPRLMETFYTSSKSRNIAQSLQVAQIDLMGTEEYSHPYYWAAFFVAGDSSNQLLASQSGARAQTADDKAAIASAM